MVEEDALKMTIFHLEGEASDWWFHGLRTLGRDHILYYEGFSNALMERFERKDPKLAFKELAQLKQVGTPEAYMLEFKKISVMVSDVSMAMLGLLFTEGDRTFERAHEIPQSSYIEGCHEFDKIFVECVLTKNQIAPKPNFPSKFKEGKKPWKNESYTK